MAAWGDGGGAGAGSGGHTGPGGQREKGVQTGRGLALLLAAAGPLLGVLDGSAFTQLVDGWRNRSQSMEQELEEEREQFYLTIIEEETAAYVMDKARELGFDCEAEVTYGHDEDGVPCPWEIAARGTWTQEQRSDLERLLETELGVPVQRQYYEEIQP